MIQIGSTFAREDAFGVKLESISSIDWNCNCVLSYCSLKSNLFIGSHLSAIFYLPNFHLAVIFAGLGLGCIAILILSGNSVINNVPESPGHVSSVAPFVSVGFWAINQLLFWKRYQFFVLVEVYALKWSCGWEGPARTTTSLVLHSCHRSFLTPVDWSRKVVGRSLCSWTFFGDWGFGQPVEIFGIELSGGKISKFVQLHWVSLNTCLISPVMVLNKFSILEPYSQSVAFFTGWVFLGKNCLPCLEFRILLFLPIERVDGQCGNSKEC